MAEGKASSARHGRGRGAAGRWARRGRGRGHRKPANSALRPGGPRQLNANEPSPLLPFVDALLLLLLCFSRFSRCGRVGWGSHTVPPSRKQGSRARLSGLVARLTGTKPDNPGSSRACRACHSEPPGAGPAQGSDHLLTRSAASVPEETGPPPGYA